MNLDFAAYPAMQSCMNSLRKDYKIQRLHLQNVHPLLCHGSVDTRLYVRRHSGAWNAGILEALAFLDSVTLTEIPFSSQVDNCPQRCPSKRPSPAIALKLTEASGFSTSLIME